MDLVDHLQVLASGREGVDEKRSLSGIENIHAALRALLPTNARNNSNGTTVSEVLIPEGVDQIKTISLWDEVAASSKALQEEKGEGSSSYPKVTTTSSITLQLCNHLKFVSQGDDALYKSILSDVQSCLEKAGASDEQISSILAETLGFDQLDLVTDLVREKMQVCSDLNAEVSEMQRVENT